MHPKKLILHQRDAMAKHAKTVFFEALETIRVAARESTQGNPQNAVYLLSKLQPTYTVYCSDKNICTCNGALRVPIAAVKSIFPRYCSSILYHCDEQKKLKFKVPLEETRLLQEQILLSCGIEFAQQYITDCFLHQPHNEFVRHLFKDIIEKSMMFPEWIRLQKIGTQDTQYALSLCARVLLSKHEAKNHMKDFLKLTTLHLTNHNHHLFMRIWDSVQEAMGITHTETQKRHFKDKPSKHSPKTVLYDDCLRLYHPDDFDRVFILTLMHGAWLEQPKERRPRKFCKFWEACGI